MIYKNLKQVLEKDIKQLKVEKTPYLDKQKYEINLHIIYQFKLTVKFCTTHFTIKAGEVKLQIILHNIISQEKCHFMHA